MVFKVTALDGSTKDYTVTVTKAPANSTALSKIDFIDDSGFYPGTINQTKHTVDVTLPYGVNLSSLYLPEFITENPCTQIYYNGGLVGYGNGILTDYSTKVNFTNPVVFTVHAEDGSTQDYTVTVTVANAPTPAPVPVPSNPAAPAPAPAVSTPAPAIPVPVAPIMTGSTGKSVSTLQEVLRENGFDCGVSDGKFGPKTRAAIIAFQKANGLRVDGVLGPITYAKLFNVDLAEVHGNYSGYITIGKYNDFGTASVQAKLAKLGFNMPSNFDGIFGPKTLAAVKAYQKAHGLVVDGIVGPITWRALFD